MRALEPLELKLEVAVSHPTWVRGTQTAVIIGCPQPQKRGLHSGHVASGELLFFLWSSNLFPLKCRIQLDYGVQIYFHP